MKCLNPNCNYFKTRAIDSRELKKGQLTKRRHFCRKCQTRYTTLEIPIYIGRTNRDTHYTLKQVINYFSDYDPYAQWQQFFKIDTNDHLISHSQNT